MEPLDEREGLNGSEIAIIGMDGRFPGAGNIDEYWNNLCHGVESVTCFSDEELIAAGVDSGDVRKPNYIKSRPVLEDMEFFDASFFGVSPLEARLMDPQQRLALECAWTALENAGCSPGKYKGAIGVFAGSKMDTYIFHLLRNREMQKSQNIMQVILGNDLAFLATRIAYKLNLRGPGITVQTACSTSLVAVHLACQSLLIDECQMALAGGVTVDIPHRVGYLYQEGSIFSPDGHCRPFDAKAQGTIFGSGIGFVVLKRLEDAIRDRDHIYAVIKGSAINNDGSLKASFSAPSVEGQTKVITEALVCADVKADTISYVETHGTGTPLGDPIEIIALQNAYRSGTKRKQYCAVGSVKGNIGHLDAAAGIASLIKLARGLYEKKIPPSLNYERPNPRIDFENSPFYINTRLAHWEKEDGPRRGAVSSFGFGGTNAHMILEEATVEYHGGYGRPYQLLPFSARTETALENMLANMERYMKNNPGESLADMAYTLQNGREEFQHRKILACSSAKEAMDVLQTRDEKRLAGNTAAAEKPAVVFVFPGQGSQYTGMRDLYLYEPAFRKEADKCFDILKGHTGIDLRGMLYGDDGNAAGILEQVHMAQAALFTIEYSLAKLLMSWGIQPHSMIGYGTGEYVAACIEGVMSLEAALAIVADTARTEPAAGNAGHFPEGPETVPDNPKSILLEIGPGTTSDFLLNTVGRLWLEGVQIEWGRMYPNEKRCRIPLPTYPFERQRYWVDPTESPAGDDSEEPNISGWFHTPLWKRSKPVKAIAGDKSCWLIFADASGIAEKIAGKLDACRQDVVTVSMGSGFYGNEKCFGINPSNADDYFRLIKELADRGMVPGKIIYLWGTTPIHRGSGCEKALEEVQDYCFNGVIYLVQALGRQEISQDVFIGLVSDNMQEVVGEDLLNPEKAVLLGPCRTIPLEYPNIRCRSIDITISDVRGNNEERVADWLIGELLDDSKYDVVAYRNNGRWIKDFERMELARTGSVPEKLRNGGVYLITGGMGGIGLVLAEYLAREVKARLVLIGRSQLPEKSSWDKYLDSHGQADETAARISKLKKIESLGGEVMVIQADITCREQVGDALDKARQRFGAIHGIIHAAGVSSIDMIQDRLPGGNLKVLEPKVKGTFVLYEALKDEKPDFFALCSSTAADTGVFGQVEYCAANAFLDAFSYYSNHQGHMWTVSINWDIWKGIGMSAGVEVLEGFRGGISPEEGVDAFKQVLDSSLSQVIVTRGRFGKTIKRAGKNSKNNISSHRPPRTGVEKIICDAWEEFLGVEDICADSNFFELGGDSIKAIQIVAHLKKNKLQVELGDLLRYPVVEELAGNVRLLEEKAADHLPKREKERWMDGLAPQKKEMLAEYVRNAAGPEAEIQDIYPLTPTQEKILFYSLYYKGTGIYFESFSFDLTGSLNLELFEKSFNLVMERYDILRTIFTFKKLDRPVQIVLKDRKSKLHFEDLTHRDEDGKAAYIEEFRKKERDRGFNIGRDVLMRMAVLKTGPEAFKVLWNFHHILMDGWGVGMVVRDLLSIYRSLINHADIRLEEVCPYSGYIRWLEGRNHHEAYAYWREYLAGYGCSESLEGFKRPPGAEEGRNSEYVFRLEKGLTGELAAVSKNSRVTLSTTCQVIWGLLLQQYNHTRDIVFGSAVSVRPPEVEGIEKMVGLFVNAIPIRINRGVDTTFAELAKAVQDTMISSEKYGYLSLMQIQENAGFKQNIADHVITFENFPVSAEVLNLDSTGTGPGFSISNIVFSERTHFNLSVMFLPGDELTVILNYNPAVFGDGFAVKIAEDYRKLAGEIAVRKDAPVEVILENWR